MSNAILLTLVFPYHSAFQLSLALHFSRNINRMLYRLLRLMPQLVRYLLRFSAPLLDLRIRPLEVECEIEVCFVLALGDSVVNEGAGIEIAEVDLRQRRPVSLRR